jgi:hypothetical protein
MKFKSVSSQQLHFTIQMPTAETGTGATNDGTLDVLPYIQIGSLVQVGCVLVGVLVLWGSRYMGYT